jgi:hypothetical protein
MPTGIYRSVPLERLADILSVGIDVPPADSFFYADCLEKAWEYGGFPKLVLTLDPYRLDRTFREIRSDLPEEAPRLRAHPPGPVIPSLLGRDAKTRLKLPIRVTSNSLSQNGSTVTQTTSASNAVNSTADHGDGDAEPVVDTGQELSSRLRAPARPHLVSTWHNVSYRT